MPGSGSNSIFNGSSSPQRKSGIEKTDVDEEGAAFFCADAFVGAATDVREMTILSGPGLFSPDGDAIISDSWYSFGV